MDLFEAVEAGDRERIQELARAGADVNTWSPRQTTALAEAVRRGSLPLVEALLAAGTSPDSGGLGVPLFDAAAGGDRTMVRVLLAAGAAPNQPDEEGYTPLIAAAHQGNLEVVRMLLEAGADVDSI